MEEDEDGHPIIVVPPAIVEDLSEEEKKEREGYARYVWGVVVGLEGVTVELLGDGAKGNNSKTKGKANQNPAQAQNEGEDDDGELGRIPEDDELAKNDEELRTIDAMDIEHDDHDEEGFAIDPALSELTSAAVPPAAATPTTATTTIAGDAQTVKVTQDPIAAPTATSDSEPAAVAIKTNATAVTPASGIPESEKADLMLLKEKYGDKVVLRASESMIMNALTGSYVRVRRTSHLTA